MFHNFYVNLDVLIYLYIFYDETDITTIRESLEVDKRKKVTHSLIILRLFFFFWVHLIDFPFNLLILCIGTFLQTWRF